MVRRGLVRRGTCRLWGPDLTEQFDHDYQITDERQTTWQTKLNYGPNYRLAKAAALTRNPTCVFCGTRPAVETHIWAPQRCPDSEVTEIDLTALCNSCHHVASTLQRLLSAGEPGVRGQFRDKVDELMDEGKSRSETPQGLAPVLMRSPSSWNPSYSGCVARRHPQVRPTSPRLGWRTHASAGGTTVITTTRTSQQWSLKATRQGHRGAAWRGMARLGRVRRGTAGPGKDIVARRGLAMPGKVG